MILKLTYNWVQVGDLESGLGEDCDWATVGEKDTNRKVEVSSIIKHAPYLDGDKLHYTVHFVDDVSMDVFNPSTVITKES